MLALAKLGQYMGNKMGHRIVMDEIIRYGNYYTQLRPYMETFDKSRFHFVDGGCLTEKPESEFIEIEKFFGIENELSFQFNETKGFPCLHRPVQMCLSEAKGIANFSNTVLDIGIKWKLNFFDLSLKY